jgi:hypothetical protein
MMIRKVKARGRKRPKKGALIIDYKERVLPDQIGRLLGDKEISGIYVLYKTTRVPYYVGISGKDVRKRLSQHNRDRHAGKWDICSFYRIKGAKYTRDLESLLLRNFGFILRGNKRKGKLRKGRIGKVKLA